jgi:lactosylceramide 4-alpha-galactosyltransferase
VNPEREVFVLFASQAGFRNHSALPIIDALLSYPNINFNYLNITQYAENTPLEGWMKSGELFRSSYVIAHTSDVLRFLSLWKYGGTHLDLDTVSLKPLNTLKPNFVGAENVWFVNNAVVNMEKTGHDFADMCVRSLLKNWNGTDWVRIKKIL